MAIITSEYLLPRRLRGSVRKLFPRGIIDYYSLYFKFNIIDSEVLAVSMGNN